MSTSIWPSPLRSPNRTLRPTPKSFVLARLQTTGFGFSAFSAASCRSRAAMASDDPLLLAGTGSRHERS